MQARMSSSTTVGREKGYFTSFNNGKLVLKCDKYDPKRSTIIGKLNKAMVAARAGDEKFIGTIFCFFLFYPL